VPYEKINKVEPAAGQIWTNIVNGDEFLVLLCDDQYAFCAVLNQPEGANAGKSLQVRMPVSKLRSWGNRGFTYARKHKGKLPAVREKVGEYNNRHVCYGAR